MDEAGPPAQEFLSGLQDIAAVGGFNAGEAMDIAASGIRAFKDEVEDSGSSLDDFGLSFATQARNLAVLSEERQRRLPDRLVTYLMARFPHVFNGSSEPVVGIVEKAVGAAAAYGIREEAEMRVFADLSVMYGEDFHREPWAEEVLTAAELTPADKMYVLEERVYKSGALM